MDIYSEIMSQRRCGFVCIVYAGFAEIFVAVTPVVSFPVLI